MANELVQVPFHGDVIEAARTEGGVYVPLRRPCESLGLAYQPQLAKLRNKPWARITMIVIHDTAGRNQELACLHLDCFPMWLATIEASRVREGVREKLAVYQKEAARVLADHFFGRGGAGLTPEGVRGLVVAVVGEVVAPLAAQLQQVAATMAGLAQALASREPARLEVSPAGALFGVKERVRERWEKAPRRWVEKVMRRVDRWCLRNRVMMHQVTAHCPLLLEQQHLPVVDGIIDEVREEAFASWDTPLFRQAAESGVN